MMRLLLLTVCLALAHARTLKRGDDAVSPAVLGGTAPKQLPQHVAIWAEGSLIGSGTLIGKTTVITTAYSIYYLVAKFNVNFELHVGATTRNFTKKNVEVLKWDRFDVHPLWDGGMDVWTPGNIAVIRLTKPSRTRPARLAKTDPPSKLYTAGTGLNATFAWKPTEAEQVEQFDKLNATTWGPQLQVASVPVVPCKPPKGVVGKYFICAGNRKTQACTYDDGGPLFSMDNSTMTLWGVTSFVFGCGQQPWATYYSVPVHFKWIDCMIKWYEKYPKDFVARPCKAF